MRFVDFLPTFAILLPVAVLLVILVYSLFAGRERDRGLHVVRRRVRCPEKGRRATVAFMVDGWGAARDVARCTLVPPNEPVTCGKECRSVAVTRFGRAARG
jgi:hypothetical protein